MDELQQLEEELLRGERRRDPEWVASVLDEGYEEFGMSGRVYGRDATLEIIELERAVERTMEEFTAREFAPDVVLTTYLSTRTRGGGTQRVRTRRSSTWVRRDGDWKLAFHHATRIPD